MSALRIPLVLAAVAACVGIATAYSITPDHQENLSHDAAGIMAPTESDVVQKILDFAASDPYARPRLLTDGQEVTAIVAEENFNPPH